MLINSDGDKFKLVSIAIYEHVETLQYAQAHALSVTLLIFAFLGLLCVYIFNRAHPVKFG